MTRNIANRIGSSIKSAAGGGIFNMLSHYIFSKSNKWVGNGTVTIPGNIQTYSPGDGYTYAVFNFSERFGVLDGIAEIDYMIVGGGGGSNGGPSLYYRGGGGAGGFRSGTIELSSGLYNCTIGAGAPNSNTSSKPNGSPSSIDGHITSAGGGPGGIETPNLNPDSTRLAKTGGSGGGGAGAPSPRSGSRSGASGNDPPVSPPQGNNGGNGSDRSSGGGGGAGGNGGSGSSSTNTGGVGGVGRAYPFSYTAIPSDWGTPGPTASEPSDARWFGGGGGGASGPSTKPENLGGAGGGGNGTGYPGYTYPYENGYANTGGGGGGTNFPAESAGGGSGIIILRYVSPS